MEILFVLILTIGIYLTGGLVSVISAYIGVFLGILLMAFGSFLGDLFE